MRRCIVCSAKYDGVDAVLLSPPHEAVGRVELRFCSACYDRVTVLLARIAVAETTGGRS